MTSSVVLTDAEPFLSLPLCPQYETLTFSKQKE
jgi:hypothetical protein